MELLMITAVSSFEEAIKRLLKSQGVKSYSHVKATGYKDLSDESRDDNWFAAGIGEQDSILFYAFVPQSNTDNVLDAIRVLNENQETESYVHAVVLDVKKSSEY